MNNKLMNGSQMVCESLIREGVEHIFGIPGGAILPLYQVLPEYEKLKHILEICMCDIKLSINLHSLVEMGCVLI